MPPLSRVFFQKGARRTFQLRRVAARKAAALRVGRSGLVDLLLEARLERVGLKSVFSVF